ncbi:MAG: Ig-like domain-containing protein [Acidobacteriaceae bacterium]|jgi:hypothetical protein
MNPHRSASPFLFLALPIVLLLAGCNALKTITITPAAGTVVLTAVGQTAQYIASGQSQMGTGLPTTSNVTGAVTWSVTNPSVATINSSGLATALGGGYTQIIAESNGITATSDLTVSLPATTTGTSGGGVASLAIIPDTQTIAAAGQTAQFIAIGTTSTGATVDLTNDVVWSSSSNQIATIGVSSGLATAVGQGTATISAIYINPTGGTVVAGTATFIVLAGTTAEYTSVTITPASQNLSASGQTGQFIALATSGTTGELTDVTNSPQIKWSSSIPTVASVSGTGLATGVSAGTTSVNVELTNVGGGLVTANATIAVTSTPPPEPLLSLTIIPASITVDNLQGTGQFLAIGTYSTAPYVRDLTNSPNLAWISTFPSVFPVDSNSGGNSGATAGLVTAYGSGSVTIIAEATNPSDGTIQTATAVFNCPLSLPNPTGNPPTPGTCYPGTQSPALLSTLTVYNEGLNTTNWEITASSSTGTPDVIHCGPGWALNGGTGGSVCTATYPVGTTVTLTAPKTGANFGGWSYNCAAQGTVTAAGPNSCTVTLTTNDTVGAIFN